MQPSRVLGAIVAVSSACIAGSALAADPPAAPAPVVPPPAAMTPPEAAPPPPPPPAEAPPTPPPTQATEAAPAPPPPAPNGAAAASGKGMPRVHIEADRNDVRLMRIDAIYSGLDGEGIMVRPVCNAPCDEVVDARKGHTYFLAGPGMIPSRGFRLKNSSGDVTARVDGGSTTARNVGFVLAGFGGAALVGGAIMLPMGLAGNPVLSSDGGVAQDDRQTMVTAGGIALGAGAALVVTGVVMIATSKTQLELVPGKDRATGIRLEAGRIVF
ncbi:hypothetical protein [Polyangium aurulentum]|uniref:hypothetical protein n=1 Tax=Polyangium aurulentum TaxID=2567896 RepID=UPI0010AE0C75|nr:hypothetical protein [Polyangium aurulentum]UQA62852.1 hypothetical protein E8A73_021320 [Polyangium aurulentum]